MNLSGTSRDENTISEIGLPSCYPTNLMRLSAIKALTALNYLLLFFLFHETLGSLKSGIMSYLTLLKSLILIESGC